MRLPPRPTIYEINTAVWLARLSRAQSQPVTLAAGPGMAAHRVIQEALTNVLKHARTNNCTLRLTYRPSALTIEVTDHGAGGVAFAIGEKVKGGHYGEMPSLEASKLVQGDLDPNMDFRSVYSTVLDKWLGLNPAPIVNGTFEQPAYLN